ncbi:MAG: riboflavin synthase [Candidatus Peribacteraceae bacterium]|nr:riboflavin synthase [Candidatus Peribacteraceae bacterium]
MFTGIIEAQARIIDITESGIILSKPESFTDLTIGASISVSGVCLSVTSFDDTSISFDVVQETKDRSTLGAKNQGDMVNLERSVRADQRMDGHTVQGHVEGVGELISLEEGVLRLKMPERLNKFCVQKGSIAIDGVSLTIADIKGDNVSVALVPHTLENTTFGSLKAGYFVNIETDIIGRYLYAFTHEEATHQG